MTGRPLSRSQIENLLEKYSGLQLRLSFSSGDAKTLAKLQLKPKGDTDAFIKKLHRQKEGWVSTSAILCFIAIPAVLFAFVEVSLEAWIMAIITGLGTLGTAVLAGRKRRQAQSIRSLEKRFGRWEFTHVVPPSWGPVAEEDGTTSWLVTQWMLTMLEIGHNRQRTKEGARTLNGLSPDDPLGTQIQIEIRTLQSRCSALCKSADADAELIDSHVQEHASAKSRARERERQRTEYVAKEAAEAYEFEQAMLTTRQAEQARLKAQERAQRWLIDGTDPHS